MNEQNSSGPAGRVSDQAIDRLVDGELAREEYTSVLRALECEPDGWRRCALAFLESQAWANELERGAGDTAEPRETVLPARTVRRHRAGRAGWILAIGASLLAAFGAGYYGAGRAPDSPPPALATSRGESTTAVERPRPPRHAPATPAIAPAGDPSLLGSLEISLEDDAGAGNGRVEIPVYALGGAGAEQVLSEQSDVPSEFVRAVEQSGGQVLRSRQWLPIPLQDGEQVLVPIEQVDIVRVSGRAFQ